MIMNRAKTPKNGGVQVERDEGVKWQLENKSEASVLGHQFAQVVALVASGSAEELLHKKKMHPPCKKIFWEEVRFNPALENTNDNYAHDAHRIEETKYWKKGGKRFVGGPRFAAPRNHSGPLAPAEFEHVFEKPTLVFKRSGQLHPFSRARPINKPPPQENPEKAYLELRTSLIGPSTYQLPDFWDSSTSHSLDPKLSAFKSGTPRFKDRKSLRTEFPVEKSGTSIPHSRGRSRGGGYKEPLLPISEGEKAARLAAASVSTWESFQEATSPEFNRSASPTLATDSLINSEVPAGKFYEISLDHNESSVHRSGPRAHSSSYQRGSRQRTPSSKARGLDRASMTSLEDMGGSHAYSHGAGDTINTPSSSQRRASRMPGFTIPTKSTQPVFDVPDYNKSYRRVLLPDGTVAILPVTSDRTRASSPLGLSKAVSFRSDPRTPVPSVGAAFPVLQLLGAGPQLRSITPPHPSPPSLTRSNLYSAMVPPSHAWSPSRPMCTSEGALLDDESTFNTVGTATNSARGSVSSYGQAVIQKWVPPVYYSSRNKGPVPDIGVIPYKPKKLTSFGVRKSVDHFALDADSTFAQSLVDELLPFDRPSSRGLASAGNSGGGSAGMRPSSTGDARRGSKVGGLTSGERRRQDSLGASQMPITDIGLRKLASTESEKVLDCVETN